MIHTQPRRTRVFRALVTPAGYRAPAYRPTSKAIGVVMNLELKDMQKGARDGR